MKLIPLFQRLHSGECNSKVLKIELEESYRDKNIKLAFVTPLGKAYVTDKLDITDDEYVYSLPEILLDGRGVLLAQIIVYEDEHFIIKSPVEEYPVFESVDDMSLPMVCEKNIKSLLMIIEELDNKSDINHNHDDIYCTLKEAERIEGLIKIKSVNGKTGEVVLTAEDVGALREDQLESSVNEALLKAKESGSFNGKDGENGADGLSAYEIAKANGFEGSEEEWLNSLKGGDLAGADLFIITLTKDENEEYISDKTGEEILTAFNENRQIACCYNNSFNYIFLSSMQRVTLYRHFIFYTANEAEYKCVSIVIGANKAIQSVDVIEGELSGIEPLIINGVTYDGTEEITVNTKEFVFNAITIDEETGDCGLDITARQFMSAYEAGRTMVCCYDGIRMNIVLEEKIAGMNTFTFAAYMGSLFFACVVIVNGDSITASGRFSESTITVNGVEWNGENPVDFTDAINKMISDKTSNPGKLILTGAVNAEYDGSSDITVNIPVVKADTETEEEETVTVLSDNLFDKTTVISGKGFYHSSGGTTIIDSEDNCISYVALRGAGTYRTKVSAGFHGDEYAARVPLMTEDKGFIQNIAGTVTETSDRTAYDLEFTVTQEMVDKGAFYYPLTIFNSNINTLMFVKDREYPSEYIPYGYIEVTVKKDSVNDKQDNVLKGKTALFFGDSICAGTTTLQDAPEYGYGWGGLIGTANNMKWKNYGKNGAVITSIEGQTRIVTDQIDTALIDYSTADYIIFEGGTNDADQLRSDSANLGTISQTQFENFDTSTFTGAFEALILKIMTSYPTAKIGYIVAQKMGLPPYDSQGSARRQYFDRAVEICKKWGIPYIDLWNGSPLNPALSLHYDSTLTAEEANNNGKLYTDGQHLTLAGYQRLVPQIEAWMRSL